MQECGNALEEEYNFVSQKIFVFNKKIQRDQKALKNKVIALYAKNNNATIKDFLEILKKEYEISQDIIKLPIENWDRFLSKNLYVLMDDDVKGMQFLLSTFNRKDVLPNKKLIISNNSQ